MIWFTEQTLALPCGKEGKMSRASLFYTRGNLQAAYLHPAHTDNRVKHVNHIWHKNICHIMKNITSKISDNTMNTTEQKDHSYNRNESPTVKSMFLCTRVTSGTMRISSEWWLNTGNDASRETLLRVLTSNGLGSFQLNDGAAAHENKRYKWVKTFKALPNYGNSF